MFWSSNYFAFWGCIGTFPPLSERRQAISSPLAGRISGGEKSSLLDTCISPQLGFTLLGVVSSTRLTEIIRKRHR